MSNGSPTAFLFWAILASLVSGAVSSPNALARLTLMLVLVLCISFIPSLELRPLAVSQVERGTATRRI